MPHYLITFGFDDEGFDPVIHDRLNVVGAACRPMSRTWVVDTDDSIDALSDVVRRTIVDFRKETTFERESGPGFFKRNDPSESPFLVCLISGDWQGQGIVARTRCFER